MRGRLTYLVVATLVVCAPLPPTHPGAVVTVLPDGKWAPGNTSLLGVEPNTPINPNCNECKTGSVHEAQNGCCHPNAPSKLNPQRCSVELPPSLYLSNKIDAEVWNNWVTYTCPVKEGSKGIVGAYGSKCDPCMTSGMVPRAGEETKWLYCENADNKKDYLTCFPATRPSYQLKCAPENEENDPFGGWELQDGAPECSRAQKEWEVAFHNVPSNGSSNGTHTWAADEVMQCSVDGSKDTTGTDHCHDDYCIYWGGAANFDDGRFPFNDFESCAKEIETREKDTACGTGTARGNQTRRGCRKSCGLCTASTKPSASKFPPPRPKDDIDLFKTCNKIKLNMGVVGADGNSVLTNYHGTDQTCEGFTSHTNSDSMGMCRRAYFYDSTSGKGSICYPKEEVGVDLQVTMHCAAGPEYKCNWGEYATMQASDPSTWNGASCAAHLSQADCNAAMDGCNWDNGSCSANAGSLGELRSETQALAVSATGALSAATTTAAPDGEEDGPSQPYYQTRELARAAARRAAEEASLLETGARAHLGWRRDTTFDCGPNGNKDAGGTDYCHDDYCVYEGGSSHPDRLPFSNFVSCQMESHKGNCQAYGIKQFMEEGCRKTCGYCNATNVVPDANGYDISG
jgi:hypothetical protein